MDLVIEVFLKNYINFMRYNFKGVVVADQPVFFNFFDVVSRLIVFDITKVVLQKLAALQEKAFKII